MRPHFFLLPGILGLMAFGMAEELSREDQRFLKERAPRLLQVIEEAKERSFDEVLEEAMERVGELQDEWREAREDGEEWAGLPPSRPQHAKKQ